MTKDFLAGHQQFRQTWLGGGRAFLERLAAEDQNPDALYIGCSDSRVVPELLTSSSPGQLFVVRNIANLVPPLAHADASVGSALDYAIGHLRVPHLIVCGHYGCGGIKAVLEGGVDKQAFPSLHDWLLGVEVAVARTDAEAPGLAAEQRWRRAVEENVTLQLENLMTFPLVAAAVREGRLTLHGWAYDLHSFELSVFDAPANAFATADGLLPQRAPR